jgi:hypothetical protein
MYHNPLERALRRLGLGPHEDRLLLLLPVLYVARAKGTLTPEESARVAAIARRDLGLGHHGVEVAVRWATEPIPDTVLHDALRELGRAARAPDVPDIDGYDVEWLLSEGEAMAREAAAHSRRSWSMDRRQRAALLRAAEVLGVDHGMPWGELLVALGDTSQPSDTFVRPEPLRGGVTRSDRWRRPARFVPSWDSVRARQARRRRGARRTPPGQPEAAPTSRAPAH